MKVPVSGRSSRNLTVVVSSATEGLNGEPVMQTVESVCKMRQDVLFGYDWAGSTTAKDGDLDIAEICNISHARNGSKGRCKPAADWYDWSTQIDDAPVTGQVLRAQRTKDHRLVQYEDGKEEILHKDQLIITPTIIWKDSASVAKSDWFKGYCDSIKAEIKVLAQLGEYARLEIMCIEGGPSQLEAIDRWNF